MPAKCFGCGADGYVQSDCPYCAADADSGKPPWCGICDRRTRLVTTDLQTGTLQRCRQCHPHRHKTLTQHRRCPECKTLAYSWDANPCGMHEGPQTPDRRLPAGRIREITGSTI